MRSSQEYINLLRLIHGSIIVGQILFLVISIWVIEPLRDDKYEIYYQVLTLVAIILGIFLAYKVSNVYIQKAKRRRGMREKLILYRRSMLFRWLVLYGISFFTVVSYIMTKGHFFIFTAIFILALIAMSYPSIDKIIENLDLDSNEKRIIRTPDAAI